MPGWSRPVNGSTRLEPVSTVSRARAGLGPDLIRIFVIRPVPGTMKVNRLRNR